MHSAQLRAVISSNLRTFPTPLRAPRAPYYLSALGARLAEQIHGSYPKEPPEMSLYTLNMH